MTIQEMIDNLKIMQAEIEWEYPLDYAATIDNVIEVLENQEGAYGYVDSKEIEDCLMKLPQNRLTNKEWIDFLAAQFDISRTSAKDMLHGMMWIKRREKIKRINNPLRKEE